MQSESRKNPLSEYSNGIYEITPQQYHDFYNTFMISVPTLKDFQSLILIKRDGYYLFGLMKDDRFYLLEGASRHLAKHEPNYYYEHLLKYVEKIEEAFFSYRQALQELSKEVQLVSGDGEIDGNTVNINDFHHIEVDGRSGKVRLYFAIGKRHVVEFDTLKDLFQFTPYPMRLASGKEIRTQYEELCQENKVPLLKSLKSGESLPSVSSILFDSKTKDATRLIRTFDYLFKYHIIRLWKENIFEKANHNVLS